MLICDSSKWNTSDILKVINDGFTAIVNVSFLNNNFYILKNKIPIDRINIEFLKNPNIIVCCHNIESFYRLSGISSIHCFSYDFKDFTLTSNKFTVVNSKNIPLESYHSDSDYVKDLIVIIADNTNPRIPKNVYGIITNYTNQVERLNFI